MARLSTIIAMIFSYRGHDPEQGCLWGKDTSFHGQSFKADVRKYPPAESARDFPVSRFPSGSRSFAISRGRGRSGGIKSRSRADPRPPDIGIINLTDNPMMDMYLIDMYFDPIESASSRRGVTRRR